jgi:hypothetical protein
MNTVFSDAVVVTLARQSFDYKLPDSETDDIGEKMNIEVAKLNAQMVTLRVETAAQGEQLRAQGEQLKAQGGQLRALQGTVLFDFIRNVISTILLVFAGEQPHKNTESHRFCNAKGPFLSRITEYVKGSN